jgi:hypothetical protein
MPVYVEKRLFTHAFYESSRRDGGKDTFSTPRATRMTWIVPTLASSSAARYQGWDSKTKSTDPNVCVFHAFGDFVVVVRISRAGNGSLKGKLVTCFDADNSIKQIVTNPVWNYSAFLALEAKAC